MVPSLEQSASKHTKTRDCRALIPSLTIQGIVLSSNKNSRSSTSDMLKGFQDRVSRRMHRLSRKSWSYRENGFLDKVKSWAPGSDFYGLHKPESRSAISARLQHPT